MIDQNPYTTPEAGPLEVVSFCPNCGNKMENGHLRSSSRIFWAHDQVSRMKNFFFGGKPIGSHRSGVGCKYDGHHCPDCRLYVLEE